MLAKKNTADKKGRACSGFEGVFWGGDGMFFMLYFKFVEHWK
jgi:hypothetical protein